MDEQTIRQRISTQRDFFATGATLPLSFRLKQLEQLKLALKRHEQDLYTALKADLGKSRMESYMCEIGLTLSELTWMQSIYQSWCAVKPSLLRWHSLQPKVSGRHLHTEPY